MALPSNHCSIIRQDRIKLLENLPLSQVTAPTSLDGTSDDPIPVLDGKIKGVLYFAKDFLQIGPKVSGIVAVEAKSYTGVEEFLHRRVL